MVYRGCLIMHTNRYGIIQKVKEMIFWGFCCDKLLFMNKITKGGFML
jgi:hypothetical protein